MTTNKAIAFLRYIKKNLYGNDHDREAIEFAIKRLKEERDRPKELRKVIRILTKEYEKAKNISYANTPIAYALYQTWSVVDIEERKRGDKQC